MLFRSIIAEMHSSTKKIKLYRKNSMGINNLNSLFNSIKFKSKKFTNIEKFLKTNFLNIKNNWPRNLPNGIIHGDLFIDNIFFKNNRLSGVIDFYFAANDFYMYEIAICVNALCFDKNKSKFDSIIRLSLFMYLIILKWSLKLFSNILFFKKETSLKLPDPTKKTLYLT